MLYYCCKNQVGHGVHGEGGSRAVTLFRDLFEAKKRCAGEIVVVDTRLVVTAEPFDSWQPLGRAAAVPAAAVVNGEPYLKPKRKVAGGGLLLRQGAGGREALLIRRRGVWDLPKGKIDKGEQIEAGARREVMEEIGIHDPVVVRYISTTRHGYARGGRYEVKDTHWYEMRTNETDFTPQAIEQIDRVEWKPWAEALALLEFETLRDLLGHI